MALLPGTHVKILAGAFSGLSGIVVSAEEADRLRDALANLTSTPIAAPQPDRPGMVWVALDMFNVRIPVQVAENDLAND